MTRSVRSYLLLWFVALTGLLLAGFAMILFLRTYDSRLDAVNDTLRARAEALAALCEWDEGRIELELSESVLAAQGKVRSLLAFEVYAWPEGDLLQRSTAREAWQAPESIRDRVLGWPPREDGSVRRRFFDHEGPGGESLRTLAFAWRPPETSPGVVILVTESLDQVHEELVGMIDDVALAAALTLAASVAAGWLLARKIVGPMKRLERAASEVRAGVRGDVPRSGSYREIDRLAEVLEHAFGRLQDAYSRQARFTSDASHELRTPLAVIRSNAEVSLRRPRDEQEYRQNLEEIARGTERMGEVLERLLLLSRVDAGRLELEQQPVDLVTLATEALDAARSEATTRNLRLELEAPEQAPLSGDAGLLRMLIDNLLSNAIRYSDGPGVVKLVLQPGIEGTLLIVEDEGTGIAPEDLPYLFDRFYRADEHRSRSTGGSGLGLSIVKAIAERHGASCAIESVQGEGTRVRVVFPRSTGP